MRKSTNKFQAIFSLIFLFLSFQICAQYDIPPKPTKQTAVYDQSQILNSSEKSRLEQKLIAYADTTSTQIVVITIPSLKGEYIGMLAAEWGEKWGVGQSQKDNGIL